MKKRPGLEKFKSMERNLGFITLTTYSIPYKNNISFDVVTSYLNGWEDVSLVIIEDNFLSSTTRIPNYEEIAYLKSLFWDDNEVCLQIHPKKSEYVNIHEHCLHLWRQIGKEYKEIDLIKDFIKRFPKNTSSSIHVDQIKVDRKKYCIISGPNRWPTWNEVCQIKNQYFDSEEPAVQYNINKEFDLNDKFIIVLAEAPDFLPTSMPFKR